LTNAVIAGYNILPYFFQMIGLKYQILSLVLCLLVHYRCYTLH